VGVEHDQGKNERLATEGKKPINSWFITRFFRVSNMSLTIAPSGLRALSQN
jgi:hypothetical protein